LGEGKENPQPEMEGHPGFEPFVERLGLGFWFSLFLCFVHALGFTASWGRAHRRDMAEYISLNSKLTMFPGVTDPDEQLIHAYRMVTTWLTAALIGSGQLHLSHENLSAAAAHLEACKELTTFRRERFADGCEAIELVWTSPDGHEPLNPGGATA
jgi:hypothetical protein